MSMFASQWFASTGASAYLLEQSLLFDDTAYLNRTPSTAGNRKTWTYSVWFKLGNTATQQLFTAGDDNNNCSRIQYQSTGTIRFRHLDGGSVIDDVETNAVFRDSSAWYHIVVSVDTTQSTDTNRVKIYINGTAQSFGTTNYPTLNFDTDFNSTVKHAIGDLPADADHEFNGLMALPILVDGSALAPTDFGETDDDGFWNPIEFVPDTVGSNLTANYVTSVSNDGGGGFATSPVTFSSVDIGTASATRKVIVGVGIDGYQGNEAYTSLTIGGVAANLIQEQNAASGGRPVALYELDVASGTSADIVVTFTGTQTKCYSMGIGVWTIEGGTLFSTVGSTANPGAGNISVSSGGTVIAIMTEGNASATYTWANLTENFDNQVRASRQAFSGASKNLSSATTQAISATSSGGSQFAMLAASFAPAGGYGTNGFQLDFADTADFGADVNYTGDTSVTFTDSSVNSGSATAYTFSSQAIGTASSDRVVAVGVSAGNSAAGINTLTVGGVSAVKAIDATNSTETELWYASVPSGTTADIVVTFSSSKGRCGIGVWALTGVTGVGATNTSTSSTATLTVSGKTKDIVLAVYAGKDHASVSFSGVTENYDEDISGAGSQYQAGGSKKLTATGSNTITVTPNTGATEVAAVSAVFLATGNNGYFSNNFTASDQLEDTPNDSSADSIGNFSTWNPNDGGGHTVGVPTEGNLQFTNAAANYKGLVSTIAFPTSGKWGVKFTITGSVSGSNDGDICIVRDQFGSPTAARSRFIATTAANYTTFGLHMNGGDIKYKFDGGSAVTHYNGAASATNDVYEFLFDADNGYFDVKENGSAFGTRLTGIPTGELYWLCADMYATGILVDFGQQGYVPSESGYSALATQNLPAPTIADGSQQFTPVLYTGTGSELAITSLDFTPDFVWIKNRDATDNHMLYDSVRGATKDLHSNTTDAETTTAQTLKSFDSAGFTLGTDVQVNTNTEDYVAWCWKAGGSASSNTDGSITTSVSANPTAGFSIISYTGNATAGATLGHGLSSAPKFILAKNRDDGVNAWAGYHVALGGTHRIFLNTNAAAQDDDGNWNDTDPSATVITLGNGEISNHTGEDFIMYAWAEVEGFSKFGSYTGNANVDGPFIYLGFRPAFILEKRTDSAGAWYITDMTRDTYNPVNKYLMPDASNAEASGSTSSAVYLDALSNGYKIRGTGAGQEYNRSGGTYIYAAFAENPFQGADGVTQARAR